MNLIYMVERRGYYTWADVDALKMMAAEGIHAEVAAANLISAINNDIDPCEHAKQLIRLARFARNTVSKK
jgi:hypothetical protein